MRRVTIAAVALLFLSVAAAQSAPTPFAHAQASTMGDVNCDAAVNTIDGLQVLRAAAGLSVSADCLVEAGDTNCDGAVNAIDSLRILRHVAGLANQPVDGCPAVGDTLVEPPTSEELIADALADGDVDYETSLLYRAYGLYGDARLPDEYRSPVVDMHAGGHLFNEIIASQGELSAGLLKALGPFLARPNDPASVFNNATAASLGSAGAPAWLTTPAAGGAARVWVQDGPDAAAALANYAASVDEVWVPVTSLMRTPNPDQAGLPSMDVNPDDAIDIYFVNVGELDPRLQCRVNPVPCQFNKRMGGYARGVAPLGAHSASGAVLIDRNVEGDLLISHLAHEIFHTAQFAYDFTEGHWLMDATATWASFRVLEHLGYNRAPVHGYLPQFFEELDLRLPRDEGLNRYASWLYFLFGEMEEGPDLVKRVWENAAAAGKQNHEAVDQELPFSGAFHQFALRNWNQEPVDPLYQSVDPTFPLLEPDLHDPPETVTAEHGPYVLDALVPPLAARYFRFVFEGDGVQSATLRIPIESDSLHVQAIRRVGDAWQTPEDWTNEREVHLCHNIQEVSELILIISNASLSVTAPAGQNPSLQGRSVPCTNWEGSASVVDTHAAGTVFTAEVTDLRFELKEDQGNQDRYVFYTLVESSPVDWTVAGTHYGCAVSGEMHVEPADGTLTPGRVNGSLVLDLYENDYEGSIHAYDPDAEYIATCPPPATGELHLSFGTTLIWFPYTLEAPLELGPVLDGDLLDDSSIHNQRHMMWRFTPAP